MTYPFDPAAFDEGAFHARQGADHAFDGGAFDAGAFDTGEVVVISPVHVSIDFILPPIAVSAHVGYVSGTVRPLVGQARARYQDGVDRNENVKQRWQDAATAAVEQHNRYQDGVDVAASAAIEWLDADRKARSSTRARYQDGVDVAAQAQMRFQEAARTPVAARTRYQRGVGSLKSASLRFQDATRGIAGQHRQRYQDALDFLAPFAAGFGSGTPLERGWSTRYQEAMVPPPGQYGGPVIPPVDLCYTPNTDLVFSTPWSADTNLVFVCENHPLPPDPGGTVIVPVKRVYVVINIASLQRVDNGLHLPTFSASIGLDVESWTWSFSAALPGRALADLQRTDPNTPVEVETMVNGVAYRFLVERASRNRSFNQDGINITGRGLGAELDAPLSPILSFGNAVDRTAEQLMADVLSENGVPLPDWAVDFQLDDWLVKGDNWKLQGTRIAALNAIVAAAGGYIQPHPSLRTLHALKRFPVLPWNWNTVTPDFELPAAVVTVEGTEWTDKTGYNRVYVSGQGSGGRLGNVLRAGSAGDVVAPMVTDALITDEIAARQRGGAILADTGRQVFRTLRMPAGVKDTSNNPLGIIPPGKFVRYVDENGVAKLGLSRSVAVDIAMPDIYQNIGVLSYESV